MFTMRNLFRNAYIILLSVVCMVMMVYAIMLGLGSNASIIVTVPFLLLYHRHMGKRSERFERFTRIVYYLSANSYVFSGLLKLLLVLIFL